MKRIRARITFSNVIAIMALFFALGGTVYAASKINGKQIKSGSIPGNRIKKNSLTGNQINEGTLKSTVTYVSVPVSLNNGGATPITATATCPSGQKAIGGSASVDSTAHSAFVNDFSFTADRTGFTAVYIAGAATESGTVTASCIPAA